MCAVLSAEVEALTREIAGDSASQEQRELAIQIAEAQTDLLRVRRARCDLLDRVLGDDYGYRSPTLDGKRVKILIHLAQTLGVDANIPDEYRELFAPLRGPDKLASILCDLAALSVMDRYERRALSRRKFAIRALDAARASGLQGSIL